MWGWWLTPLLVSPAGALQPQRSLRTTGTTETRRNSVLKFMLVLWGSKTCTVWFRLDASLIYTLKSMCSSKIQVGVTNAFTARKQKMIRAQVSIWQDFVLQGTFKHLSMVRYDLVKLCYCHRTLDDNGRKWTKRVTYMSVFRVRAIKIKKGSMCVLVGVCTLMWSKQLILYTESDAELISYQHVSRCYNLGYIWSVCVCICVLKGGCVPTYFSQRAWGLYDVINIWNKMRVTHQVSR